MLCTMGELIRISAIKISFKLDESRIGNVQINIILTIYIGKLRFFIKHSANVFLLLKRIFFLGDCILYTISIKGCGTIKSPRDIDDYIRNLVNNIICICQLSEWVLLFRIMCFLYWIYMLHRTWGSKFTRILFLKKNISRIGGDAKSSHD